MSKVIRISEEIFARLQELSEPLVDTPASVITRLLDSYEGGKQTMVANNPIRRNQVGEQGLFLAPANEKNLQDTIINGISPSIALPFLDNKQFSNLSTTLRSDEKLRCWAMTKNSRSRYDSMKVGDLVLFTTKGSGRFSYSGVVTFKVENKALGEALWSVVPGLPWELIYFLGDIVEINIPKERLVKSLGYNPGYVVPGITRVDPHRIAKVVDKYKGLAGFLKTLKQENT